MTSLYKNDCIDGSKNPCIVHLQNVPAHLWEGVGLPPLSSQEAKELPISNFHRRWTQIQQMEYEDNRDRYGDVCGYSPDQEQGPWITYHDFVMKLILRVQKYYRRGIHFMDCDPALLLAIKWPIEFLLDIQKCFVYPCPRTPPLREEDGNLDDIQERFKAEIAEEETENASEGGGWGGGIGSSGGSGGGLGASDSEGDEISYEWSEGSEEETE
jgi:hypothetical protein